MPAELEAAYTWCRRMAARSASQFYPAFWMLPAAKFRSTCALYAFLRAADDLADEPGPAAERFAALTAYRRNLELALKGSPPGPLWLALADTVQTYQVPHEYLHTALDGVESDLAFTTPRTFAELEAYCFRVAGVVGLACIHIWGCSGPEAIPHAVAGGVAFQLTNILRDLKEDATRGRVYLPQEDLDRFGYSAADLTHGVRNAAYRELARFQIARAEDFYRRATPLAAHLQPDGRRVWRAMLSTYHGLLHEIGRREGDVFTSRVRLPRWKRWWILAQACWPPREPSLALTGGGPGHGCAR